MARIERTYSQEKVKQMLKLNEVLLDYLQRESYLLMLFSQAKLIRG